MTAATAPHAGPDSPPTTPIKAGTVDATPVKLRASTSPAEADFAAALAAPDHPASLAETSLRSALATYGDSACMTVAFAELEPEHTRAGEKEFAGMLHAVLAEAGATCMQWDDLLASEQYSAPLPKSIRRSVRSKIVAVNAFKVLRSVGIKAGPAFIPHTKFPLWRPATWTHRKVVPGVAFVGVGEVRTPKTVHPFDYVRSTRFNNCVMVRETPVPAIHAGEDYVAHHMHGLQSIARLLTLAFIDVDSTQRTFRVYQVQGCSRLYGWDELADPRVARAVAAKVFVKGRIPRSRDFGLTQRKAWSDDVAAIVRSAQARVTAMMPALDPLLSINLTPAQLLPHCVLDIAPAVVAAFLDGRSGMSYGFLAYIMPVRDVDTATRVDILCTRSGCNKKAPHKDKDWVILSCDADALKLETDAALRGVTSPSFDSWLILAQAAANVSLAKRLKAADRCASYVRAVETEGLALAHFHGFCDRASLPAGVAYFGQDRPPLPCGSVDAALITLEEKALIGDKILAADTTTPYVGDVHIEPDHGVVIAAPFDTLEALLPHSAFGLSNYETYKQGAPGRGERPFHQWAPAAEGGCAHRGCGCSH